MPALTVFAPTSGAITTVLADNGVCITPPFSPCDVYAPVTGTIEKINSNARLFNIHVKSIKGDAKLIVNVTFTESRNADGELGEKILVGEGEIVCQGQLIAQGLLGVREILVHANNSGETGVDVERGDEVVARTTEVITAWQKDDEDPYCLYLCTIICVLFTIRVLFF